MSVQTELAWNSPAAIAEWWKTDRQASFARPYSAELVARLRQPIKMEVASNVIAMKLRDLLLKRQATKTASLTFGATDPVAAHIMGEAGFDILYVSGAACSIADVPGSFDVGEDLADYPYNTVPAKVEQIYRSQLQWARVDQIRKHSGSLAKNVDRLVPIIADADSGHGAPTATMKMTRLFVDVGASGIHIDDLYSGVKKFGTAGNDHVVVPISEHIRRLLSAKLQMDVMGSEALLVHRTDVEMSDHITSTIDPRDRPFILGSTNPDLPSLAVAVASGTTEADWKESARLLSVDEAVAAVVTASEYDSLVKATAGLTSSDALRFATRQGHRVFWDADAGRTPEGWYLFRGGIEAAVTRAVAASPYADIVWTCTPEYIEEVAQRFATGVHAAYPGKLLAFNWTGPFMSKNPSDADIKGLTATLSRMGYVWQFCPLGGQAGAAVGFQKFADKFHRDGMLGFVEDVLRGGGGVDFLGWVGQTGQMADAMTNAVEL